MHKHMYEYMRETCARLDDLVRQLKQLPDELRLLPDPPAAPDVA